MTCKTKVLVAWQGTPRAANFTSLEPGTTPLPQVITLKRADGGPIKPEVGPISVAGVTAEIRELVPGEQYEMIVALSPPLKSGALKGSITLNTGINEIPTTMFQIYAQVPPGME